MQRRSFAATTATASSYANAMTKEQAELLHDFQTKFERNPTVDSAYKLFRELNKHHMYLTVIRLYWKHEMSDQSSRGQAQSYSMMQSQYEYAKDHIQQNRMSMSDGSEQSSTSSSVDTGEWPAMDTRAFKVRLLDLFFTIGLFFGFGYYMYQEMEKMKGQSNQFGVSNKNEFEFKKSEEIKERLDDVKGIDEIKDEIINLIRMIRDPNSYTSKGAKMHKGVLLHGSPGTGKTMLSRAIAGEAGVSFLYCTGSSFDEMFVGVGAKRIRELFSQARKEKPCIIFIDEIDTLLAKSRRFGREHSSSRATINQFLTELDGFQQNDGILVIGATNHQDSLDPAAVRPGRFDKKIHVPSPDVNGRTDIFQIYLNKIAKSEKVEAKKLAQMTPGFTGAEIENLVNTAITEAVHHDKEEADPDDFEYARDRIMMGIERKKLSVTEKERLNTAIHEAGHTVACYYTENAKKLYKATIVARGASLGATFMIPDESDSLSWTKEKVLANIDVAMGGHCAEELFIGTDRVTTGCSNDLQGATKMAYGAVE